MRAADYLVDLGPGRRRARRRDRRAQGTPGAGDPRPGVADRPATCRAKRAIPVPPSSAARGAARSSSAAPASTTSRASTPRSRSGTLTCVTGVSGSGKSTLVNEILYRSVANRLHRARTRPGAHDRIDGLEADRQGDQHRPVADRADAALEPGHLHGRLRPHPPALREDARRPGRVATSPAGSASTSRAAAARSARATARSRSRCTSCPTSTSPASSATAAATTARRSRCGSRASRSPTCSRCRSTRRVDFFAQDPEDPAAPEDAARRRARIHPARPAGDDALGRRGAAREARHRALEGRHRATPSTSSTSRRPASTSPTSSACSTCSRDSSTRATPSS